MLEPVCGPCVGMGQAPPSDSNSLRTFNRNFPGRSGTPEDSVFLCSPAVAAVSLLSGKIADPREYGEPPELLPMPELRPYVDDVHIFAPAEPERGGEDRDPARARTSSARRSTRRCGDSLEACIATVQPDDISTGDLAPDGVEVMAYRSNVPAIAEFTLRHRDPDFRKRLKEWGSGFIVAGENYGQGSSREHAALAPLHLGVKAVIAKSFARIHRRNLIAQGIVALTFSDESDYDKAEVGQKWSMPKLREELENGSETITAKIEDGDELTLSHDFSEHEREILLAGGLLVVPARGRVRQRRRAIRGPGQAGSGDNPRHATVISQPSARGDEQGLRRASDPAALVEQHALGEPDPAGGDPRRRLEADPLADRLAFHVQRQVDVDEQVVLARKRPAQAGAEVGGRGQALDRRGRLAAHQRARETKPGRAGAAAEPADDEADIVRVGGEPRAVQAGKLAGPAGVRAGRRRRRARADAEAPARPGERGARAPGPPRPRRPPSRPRAAGPGAPGGRRRPEPRPARSAPAG